MSVGARWGGVRLGLLAALSLATVLTLFSAPTALAAPPANDDFANAEPLGPALPIEVSGSTVEATKEAGEYLPGLAPAGHSVWFGWEAPSTGYVTIDSCGSEIPTLLDVFTGSALNSLTTVGGGNTSEGPHCSNTQSESTFKATEGTVYKIAVDGNSFYPPLAEPPMTEGAFTLRIEATPAPPNDAFAAAAALEGSISEEPGGARRYNANSQGYNWEATTETGEPFYGTNAGASVWYSWTPPESGTYLINGSCCNGAFNWSLFAGTSFGNLSEVLSGPGCASVSLPAGGAYRIVVWGTPDLATEEPSMGSFVVQISADLMPRWLLEALEHPPGMPPPPTPSESAGSATTASPETKILEHVLKRRPPVFVFHFRSSEPGSTFRCKLDRHPFAPCSSSLRLGHLKPGRHSLRVAAVDVDGSEDPTPAIVRFRVPGIRKHHRARKHHRHRTANGKVRGRGSAPR
jgi:hypothetical protein